MGSLTSSERSCWLSQAKGEERPLLSLVVPTLNEAENLPHLLRRVARALRGIRHEVIVVDGGSTDGTADLADELAGTRPELRVLHRSQAERGLSAAILAGFRHARGDVLAVMDADLQHDPAVLPGLVAALGDHDLAIGSRYTFRGKTCGWSFLRELQSRAAAALTRLVLRISVRDPLSGFFAIRRSAFELVAAGLQPRGWKLLLDILATAPRLSVAEVPMTFRARCRGKTKMNPRVVREWLGSLRGLRSVRFGHDRRIVASMPREAAAIS
jgi:dolichol-phosphate mannosyltransferase